MLEQWITALVMMVGNYRPEAITRLALLACAGFRTRHGYEQRHLSWEQYLRRIERCRQAGKGNWIVAVCCAATLPCPSCIVHEGRCCGARAVFVYGRTGVSHFASASCRWWRPSSDWAAPQKWLSVMVRTCIERTDYPIPAELMPSTPSW